MIVVPFACAARDLVSNTFKARASAWASKNRPRKIPQAGGDQKDGKHCKYQWFLQLSVSQNHDICVVFGAFTPGNHVSTDGLELSSAQNHGIYMYLRCFLEKRNIFSIAHRTPKNVDIYTAFATPRHVFSRSKFVKTL